MRRRFSCLLALVGLVVGLSIAITGCGPMTAGLARSSDGSSPSATVFPKTGGTPTPATTPSQAAATPTPTHAPRLAPTPTSAPAAAPATFASRALARTNAYRRQFNCPPLRENAQLDQAAFAHSQDMAVHNYFDHNSPSGQTPWDRIHAAGYQFSMAAENIAAGYPTPEAVIDAFFNETPPNDGHRRNLLNCALRDVGFAYYYQPGSKYGSYWTQDFATPL
ncbi:MAG TPA: CAP domain-containing protein [Ktedonobacterales bacterium]|jgi:uncharacterized protein YkwD